MKNLTKKVVMVIFCAVLLGTVCGCGNDEYEKRIAELERQLEEAKNPKVEDIKDDYSNQVDFFSDIEHGRNMVGKVATVRVGTIYGHDTFKSAVGYPYISVVWRDGTELKKGDIVRIRVTDMSVDTSHKYGDNHDYTYVYVDVLTVR